ncbi:hypothetical protein FGO68_gene14119 [Halteria grandinella]|uniref:Uncharacterized protein n=1 Tax=Halteria grandinella TaxID=5974 RepID=A0A8J8NTZ5_HALGN|nr:hypothetical protein FGO68_gene14119 [Halteria grandinella]
MEECCSIIVISGLEPLNSSRRQGYPLFGSEIWKINDREFFNKFGSLLSCTASILKARGKVLPQNNQEISLVKLYSFIQKMPEYYDEVSNCFRIGHLLRLFGLSCQINSVSFDSLKDVAEFVTSEFRAGKDIILQGSVFKSNHLDAQSYPYVLVTKVDEARNITLADSLSTVNAQYNHTYDGFTEKLLEHYFKKPGCPQRSPNYFNIQGQIGAGIFHQAFTAPPPKPISLPPPPVDQIQFFNECTSFKTGKAEIDLKLANGKEYYTSSYSSLEDHKNYRIASENTNPLAKRKPVLQQSEKKFHSKDDWLSKGDVQLQKKKLVVAEQGLSLKEVKKQKGLTYEKLVKMNERHISKNKAIKRKIETNKVKASAKYSLATGAGGLVGGLLANKDKLTKGQVAEQVGTFAGMTALTYKMPVVGAKLQTAMQVVSVGKVLCSSQLSLREKAADTARMAITGYTSVSAGGLCATQGATIGAFAGLPGILIGGFLGAMVGSFASGIFGRAIERSPPELIQQWSPDSISASNFTLKNLLDKAKTVVLLAKVGEKIKWFAVCQSVAQQANRMWQEGLGEFRREVKLTGHKLVVEVTVLKEDVDFASPTDYYDRVGSLRPIQSFEKTYQF